MLSRRMAGNYLGTKTGLVVAVLVACLAFGDNTAKALEHPWLEEFGALGSPEIFNAGGVTVDQASGDVLVIDRDGSSVYRYHPDGTPSDFPALGTNVIDGKRGPGGKPCIEEAASCDETPEGGLNFGGGPSEGQVAIDNSGGVNNGNIYVTFARLPFAIEIFAPSGGYAGQLSRFDDGAELRPFVGRACGVAVDGAGAVYAGDRSFGVHKYVPAANPPGDSDNTAAGNFAVSGRCTLAAGEGASAGYLFAAKNNGEVSKLDSTTGALLYDVSGGANTRVSVDPADGHVYIAKGSAIEEYDASGAGGATLEHTIPLSSAAQGVGVDEDSGKVYVSREGSPRIDVYGPAVPTAPSIRDAWVVSATGGEAELQATVNPNGFATTYRIEYGPGQSYGSNTAEREVGSGDVDQTVGLTLAGLEPGAAYHWRVVVTNSVGSRAGPDRELWTYAPLNPRRDCPNALLRLGAGALLPDCRGFEMVSPLDKAGGDILAFETPSRRLASLSQAAASGQRLTYSSYRAFGDASSSPYSSQYLSTREAGGWSSAGISPSRGVLVGGVLAGYNTEFRAFSDDLCLGWLARDDTLTAPLSPDAVEGRRNLYRRDNCGGGFKALGFGGPLLEVQGFSADGSRTLLRTQAHLAQDAASEVGSQARCESSTAAKSIAHQWLADGEPIAGATGATYELKAADEGKAIQCQVSAINENAGSTQIANAAWIVEPYPVTPPPEAPKRIAAPSASEAPVVGGPGGQTLSCDAIPGSWGEEVPALSYRWLRNGEPIAGETGQSYVPSAAELASPAAFQCVATASYGAGPAVAKASENLLTSPAPDDPPAPTVAVSTEGAGGFDAFLYEHLGGSQLRTVCVNADGTQRRSCSAGTASGGIQTDGRSQSVIGAYSADGEKIYWSDSGDNQSRIFVRVGGAETIAVSPSAAQFWGAAADGSRALFSLGTNPSFASELQEFDLASEESHLIAAETLGLMGISEDATRAYFVSRLALSEGAEAGKSNLYLRDAGAGTFVFVARLAEEDADPDTGADEEPTPVNVNPYRHLARVSPDGGSVAFMSVGSPTGYDNADRASGEPDAEVYRYEAATGALDCISCNPSGARPTGRNIGSESRPYWAAATIGGAQTQLHASRALSADGSRVFFTSFDPLVPRDTNAKADVYEWEEPGAGGCTEANPSYSPANGGCLSLITSGKSPYDSEFLDASTSGDDAFFNTGESLVATDPGSFDIYDARVEGGFPLPGSEAPCEGDACQSPPAAVERPTPTSLSYRGRGNLRSRACDDHRRRAAKLARRAGRLRRGAGRVRSAKRAKLMRRKTRRLARRARAERSRERRCRRARRRARR